MTRGAGETGDVCTWFHDNTQNTEQEVSSAYIYIRERIGDRAGDTTYTTSDA